MGAHLVGDEFQSDKYPTTPPGKVPLSVRDVTAQDLLWAYARRRRLVDAEFSDDLEEALRRSGYAGLGTPGVDEEAALAEIRSVLSRLPVPARSRVLLWSLGMDAVE